MRHTHLALTLIVLLMPGLLRADIGGRDPDAILTVDVFTTSAQPVVHATDTEAWQMPMTVRVHTLDRVEQFKAGLSRGLARDPALAKRQVLARFKTFDQAQYKTLQAAAQGLALAVQYGVDRYPAIVFNGQWVVYGEADLRAALQRYRDWQRSKQP